MFENCVPTSLWLCVYRKCNCNLKILQNSPNFLAMLLCAYACVLCMHVHVCASSMGTQKTELLLEQCCSYWGTSKGIRSNNSIACREILRRTTKCRIQPSVVSEPRDRKLPGVNTGDWAANIHSNRLPSVGPPLNSSFFQGFVCASPVKKKWPCS